MRVRRNCTGRFVATAVVCILLGGLPVCSALAGQIELTPAKDATLYQYDHGTYVAGAGTYPKADGIGNLHVGDTNNNNGVQRGLLQFYFDPDVIPANAIVTDVSLTMTVADVPTRVLQRDINFWMVAMEGLSGEWAQGPGKEQSPAVPGDTTWFHTEYDPAVHGELGNANNPLRDFSAGDPGYWPAPGYFGQADLLDTAPGAGVGGPFDDAHALVLKGVPGARGCGQLEQRPHAQRRSSLGRRLDGQLRLDADRRRMDHRQPVTGKARVEQDRFLLQRDGRPYYAPPLLTVTYHVVPEPSSILLLVTGLGMFWWRWRRHS